MKTHEVVLSVLGVLGFLLGCYNLWRSTVLSRRASNLMFAEHRAQALKQTLDGKAAYLKAKREFMQLKEEATQVNQPLIAPLIEDIDKNIVAIDNWVQKLQTSFETLTQIPADGRSHEELILLVDSTLSSIVEATHTDVIEQEAALLVMSARQIIAKAKEV